MPGSRCFEDILIGKDYDPFGMLLVGRNQEIGSGYKYGFNGKEQDDETDGNGNIYDYGFRIYNSRLGKFLSVDPLSKSFAWYTPYQFAGNKPIVAVDLDGLEEVIFTESFNLLKAPFLESINASELLNSVYKDVSDPTCASTSKVYFMCAELPAGTKAITINFVEGAEFLTKYNNGEYDKSDNDVQEAYLIFSGAFKSAGLTPEQVKEDYEKDGTERFGVIINERRESLVFPLQEDPTENGAPGKQSLMKDLFHEIDAHLINDVFGVEKSALQEHDEQYNYSENACEYEEVGFDCDAFLGGGSPKHNQAIPGCEQYEINKEIDKVVK